MQTEAGKLSVREKVGYSQGAGLLTLSFRYSDFYNSVFTPIHSPFQPFGGNPVSD
jgi:hypothetical protein